MAAEFDISSYMEELQEEIKPYLKEGCFASDPVYSLMTDMAESYDATEEDVEEIVGPTFRNLGYQAIDVSEEYYLAPGASEEEIYDTMIRFIEEHDLDADMIYFLGVDDFSKKHEDLFNKLANIVFFAVEDLPLGMQVIAHTSYLLRFALEAHHLKLYPQDAERCRGWVDEETIDIVGPFFKDGHIPGWVYEDVLRDLVAELGDYPLSQNVMGLSLDAMGAKTLFLAKEYWLPVGSNEQAIMEKLHKLLTVCNVDIDRCFTEGMQIIPRDVLELARNIVFFGDAGSATLYQAEIVSGNLLSRLITGDRAMRNRDERVTTDVVNRDMAMALRMYAKDGYVPSFVVIDQYNRIMAQTRNAADAAAIRDGTMASLSLKTAMLDAERYLPSGTTRENIRRAVLSYVSGWNLEKVYETGSVPDENTGIHNQLVSMIFFADVGIHDLAQANSFFFDCLLSAVNEYLTAAGRGAPSEMLREIETVCLQWHKRGLLPSFLRRAAMDALLAHVSQEWFAEYLYTSVLDAHGIEELELDGPDYLAPSDAGRLGAHTAEMIRAYEFDLGYIEKNSMIREEDEPKKILLANMLYFAVDQISTVEEAYDYAEQLLLKYVSSAQQTRRRRIRQM